MKRIVTLLCALAMLVALIPAGVLPVSAGKALAHRSETTLLEEILERDGFIEGIWYPWFTHTYLGCDLTSNELAAEWLNGWPSGVTNCWYDFSKVGIDEYGADKIYQEIYNLKSMGYNMLGYEGSIYGEGVIYDATGDVIGIKDEYLYNVRRFLDMCRDIGMPVLWTVCCHTSSVNQYYTNGKAFSDMATRFYADNTVADHYAERFVKPLAKVLSEYPDVVAMVAATSEAENEINDSQVGNQFGGTRDLYGVSQENMHYFVNAVVEAIKAEFPKVPRTLCCQLSDMSFYSDVDFDLLGDQNYNWAGRSDPIDEFRPTVPMFVSEFGMGDEFDNITDKELTDVQITFRKNFRSTGYLGCFMWCWTPTGSTGSAYDLLKKGAKNTTDFRSTAYELYYYIIDQRAAHSGDKSGLDTPMLFCNTGNGLLEWATVRQATKIDILRSDDGGKNWVYEVKNDKYSDYENGYKGQYVSEVTPTANTVFKIVVRDDKGNEKTSQVTNKSSDRTKFNQKYTGSKEDNKSYDFSGYPLALAKKTATMPMVLSETSVAQNRPSSDAVNLIKDGSFESSSAGFTTGSTVKVVSDSTAPEGSKSLYFDTSSTSTAEWHIIWIDVEKNTDYVFSAWVKGAHLSTNNRGWATVGVVDSEVKRFIPYTGKLPFFTQSKQIVPPGWDEEWHLRSVSFNSGSYTKVGIGFYGCSTQMWMDGLALYKNGNGVKYVAPINTQITSTRFDAEHDYCAEKNNVFKNPTIDSKSSNFWQTGAGWDSGFLSIASNKYEYGTSIKYTATSNPVGMHYLKWVDVEPNTWYTFSVDIKVLKSGAGRVILLDGKMRDPDEIVSVEFDGDGFGEDWFCTNFRLYTGNFTKLAFGVVDGGGSALIDNLRLFKTSDGIDGDDPYKDPDTGNNVTAPTGTAKPTVIKPTGTTTGTEVENPTSGTDVADPTEGDVTEPTGDVGGDVTDPTTSGQAVATEASKTTAATKGGDKDEDKDQSVLLSALSFKDDHVVLGVILYVTSAVVLATAAVLVILFLRKKKKPSEE